MGGGLYRERAGGKGVSEGVGLKKGWIDRDENGVGMRLTLHRLKPCTYPSPALTHLLLTTHRSPGPNTRLSRRMILCKTCSFDGTFRQGGTTVFSSGRIPQRVSDRSWTVGARRCQDTSWGIIMEGRGRGLDNFGLFAATGGWESLGW